MPADNGNEEMLEIKSSYNRREAAVAATIIVTAPTYYTWFDGRPVEALPGPAKLYTGCRFSIFR